MQDYSVKRPLKNKILFVLAALSMVVSHLLNSLIEHIECSLVIHIPTVMAGTIFILLWILFDRLLWKTPLLNLFCQTPNLNGVWLCEGHGKKQNDAKADNPWSAKIKIVQTFSEISIHMSTIRTSSHSDSFGATIEKINGTMWKLSYPYKNTPVNGSDDMHSHDGFCQLIFDLNEGTAEGYYFTNNDRKSFGNMKLKKE